MLTKPLPLFDAAKILLSLDENAPTILSLEILSTKYMNDFGFEFPLGISLGSIENTLPEDTNIINFWFDNNCTE